MRKGCSRRRRPWAVRGCEGGYEFASLRVGIVLGITFGALRAWAQCNDCHSDSHVSLTHVCSHMLESFVRHMSVTITVMHSHVTHKKRQP